MSSDSKSKQQNKETNQQNQQIIDDYISRMRMHSNNSANAQEGIIKECVEYANKPIYNIEKSDVINFISNVLSTRISKKGKNKGSLLPIETKKVYCQYIKAFFDDLEYRSSKENNYRSPVPPIRLIKFFGSSKKMKNISKREKRSFSEEEINKILEYSKAKEFRDFIIFSLLSATGMRISECLTIKIENVNLKERYIETGKVMDARKSNRALIFFYPEGFSSYLETYILMTGRKNGWLFESKRSTKHLSTQSFRITVKRRYGDKYQQFHRFRRSIITHRIDLDCPPHISEILVNHVPSSVEFKHYYDKLNKDNIPELREWYDKWFPYKNIPYF